MKTYRSKIDWWLMLIVFAATGWPIIDGIITGEPILILIFVVINALLIWMFSSTNYTIDGGILLIRCGFFGKQKIVIGEIKSVKKTNNPLSAPALSLKRLEIKYGKFDSALISPKERAQFITHLLSVNPSIHVKT